MSEKPYTTYIRDHDNLILRDYLAIDRTMLANETSFMSYVRTALTLIAAGATLIKFFTEPTLQALGWAFVFFGGLLAMQGYNRYRKVDKVLHEIKGEIMEPSKRLALPRRFIATSVNVLLRRS